MEANLGNALILVAIGILIGVAISFGFSVITASSDEQVSIQEQVDIAEDSFEEIDRQQVKWHTAVWVYHDNKRNVTCWVSSVNERGGGISCIPDHMLTP